MKHGLCTVDYGDGTKFTGQFVNNKMHGEGRYDMEDGAYY